MVYANADLTKAERAREVLAFADYWQRIAGEDPGLLVFDSKLTTYKVLGELSQRGIRWLTLRERGPKLMADLAQLPGLNERCFRLLRPQRHRCAPFDRPGIAAARVGRQAATVQLPAYPKGNAPGVDRRRLGRVERRVGALWLHLAAEDRRAVRIAVRARRPGCCVRRARADPSV